MPKTLASFCRLCLTKTSSKVPVFGGEQENVTNLLALIELSINAKTESNAAVCYDCIVTLETFLQYKDQCHVNDKFLKSIPLNESVHGSDVSEADEDDDDAMECDFLEEHDDDGVEARDSEEEGLVKDFEPPKTPKKTVTLVTPRKKSGNAKQLKPAYIVKKIVEVDPLDITKRMRSQQSLQEIAELSGPQPTEDELPELLDSYPDFFHFEKRKNNRYYDLVYHGQRFNSAMYNTTNTLWQCAHRRKFKCPAFLHVSLDYTEFERRNEHTHGEQTPKEEFERLTPQQVLPILFRLCWQKVKERKARKVANALAVKQRVLKQRAMAKAEKMARLREKRAARYNKKPIPSLPVFPDPQPTADELPKLQASYPDCFHFERGHNTLYYDLVYYGERFNSAIFGARHTFWQCAHRRKFKCPAMLHVSNDYTEFERRYEHTHGEQKSKGYPELYTPKQALPTLFRIMWHRLKEKRLKKQQTKGLAQEAKNNDELGHGDSYEDYESSQKEFELPENGSVDD
uniref:ZAD domain-containing protein n=1 Tax=Culex tarsalis TaxID=7177 RepID=A0A1Q3EZ17_CULTA